jgi:hypothetical protein
MKYRWPRNGLPYAVSAQVIIAKHGIPRADKPEIVQRLDYRSAACPRGAIDRRRHDGKYIVEMGQLYTVAANKLLDRFGRLRIPYRVPHELQPSHALNRIVVKLVADHVVSVAFEQIGFRGEHLVFASRLLIAIMGNEYTHCMDVLWTGYQR